MELISTAQDEDLDHSVMEALRVRAWRVEQLRHLGLPHTLAALIERGCPPQLALEIVR